MTRLEREKQVQKQKNIIYLCSIAFIIILIILVAGKITGNSLKAEASLDGSYVYETVIIEDGDTLWSIAQANHNSYAGSLEEYINEIKVVNNLNSDFIEAGEYLILPLYQGSL